jgi:hypothetical protein
MFQRKYLPAMLVMAIAASQTLAALADPLIDGAPTSPAFIPPAESQPPPIGSGPTPWAVTPGMGGAPTLEPWVTAIPANSVDQSISGIPLPVNPAVVSPPGVLGPALTGLVPGPESTLGSDPGSLTAPRGYINAADQVNINPNGGMPGTGGYEGTINRVRRGGQETHQLELRGRNSILAGVGGDGSQGNVARLGPWAGYGVVDGVPTGNGMRTSSIDLGGGQRFKVGGTVISTGSTIQDNGVSATRNNPVRALRAQAATEFGQGFHGEPVHSNKTTDYGGPFKRFSPANETPQKINQLKLPTAIETNN